MALEDKLNQAKGALKENAGKLTGDKQLEAEGTIENTVAKVKDVANTVAEDIKKTADDAKDAVEGAISGLKNALGDDDK
ncbi:MULTISPECIES: CsbD family protein [Veillonella]|uniref:CsbD family protein n=1 Tax=Veillonella TaxID=29465 RepID=UPI0021515384|nr:MULTISPECIES: CsbD family protein [Veillonella]